MHNKSLAMRNGQWAMGNGTQMGSELVRTDASPAWSLSVRSLGHILWEPRLAELLHRTRFGEIVKTRVV